MRPFLKPVRLSLKYKWTLLASMINALAIGLLWSISITAIYPVLEVVFQGRTVHDWAQTKLERSTQELESLEQQIEARRQQPPGSVPAQQTPKTRRVRSLQSLERQWAADQAKHRMLSSVYGHVGPYLPDSPFRTLVLLMQLLVLATFIKGLCIVAQAVLVARVAERTVMDLRRIYFRQLLLMDQLKIDHCGTAQLMTMLSHNINLVGTGLRSLYGQSIREPLKMLACLTGAALISPRLLILALLVTPLGAGSLILLARRVKNASLEHMGGITAVLQTVMQTVNGVRIVRVFNRERTEAARFRRNSETVYHLSRKMHLYDAILNPVTELVGILGMAVAVLAGGWLVMNEQTELFGIEISSRPLTPSAVFLFFGLLAGASGPARKLSAIYNNLIRASMAATKLEGLFHQPLSVITHQPRRRVPEHRKAICFENVCFAYRPMHRILHHIDLQIPFGQTVALVGPNGCGKTTLLQLLARFYDPVIGRILLDDVDLKFVNPRKLRRQIAMITQQPVLFDGTIEHNIAYGNRYAQQSDILWAATQARVSEFVGQLPDGWKTRIGDQGKFLSGGQRQRIALARALVARPRILMLDEATSQVDQKAEVDLHQGLRSILGTCTTLMVTHRLASIQLCDRVLVMKRGRIVEDISGQVYLQEMRDMPVVTNPADSGQAA